MSCATGTSVFLKQPMSQFNAIPGSNVEFSVTLGIVHNMLVWRKNGSQLVDPGKYIGLNTMQLTVRSVDESDEGVYTIDVFTPIGVGSFEGTSEFAWLTVCELCMYMYVAAV